MGRENARYPRPCAIVISLRPEPPQYEPPGEPKGEPLVMVVPITHSPPGPGAASLELPARIKARLGLDDARSWVILDEANQFVWPGYDLELNDKGEFAYGLLPPAFFEQVRQGVLNAVRARRLARVR